MSERFRTRNRDPRVEEAGERAPAFTKNCDPDAVAWASKKLTAKALEKGIKKGSRTYNITGWRKQDAAGRTEVHWGELTRRQGRKKKKGGAHKTISGEGNKLGSVEPLAAATPQKR